MPIPNVITGPSFEPLTLSAFLEQSRIGATTSSQDALIEQIFIPAARGYIEWRAGITIHEQTLEVLLEDFRGSCGRVLELPRATPLIEVVGFYYKDSGGTETQWTGFVSSPGGSNRVGRVTPAYGQWWPSFVPYPLDPFRIRYRAGIANNLSPMGEASAEAKYAMCLLVAGMYENRESEVITDRKAIEAISMNYGAEAFIERLKGDRAY